MFSNYSVYYPPALSVAAKTHQCIHTLIIYLPDFFQNVNLVSQRPLEFSLLLGLFIPRIVRPAGQLSYLLLLLFFGCCLLHCIVVAGKMALCAE